jgi:hypothetical protein
VGFKWSQDNFFTREHSLQVPIFDEERQQLYSLGGLADPVFGGVQILDPEQNAVDKIVRSIMINHENKVATVLRNTATYPANNTVTLVPASNQCWDQAVLPSGGAMPFVTSDPVANILTGMRAVYSATLRWPNVLAIPTQGMSYIEQHPRIVDRFKYFSLTQPDAFQAITGFQGQVILLDSTYNAAQNLDQTLNLQWFWGKDVWLGIVDPTLGMNVMTFGKTFAQIYPDGTTRPTERWREESRKADIIRTNFAYDLKVVASGAGYLIKQAFSPTAW